MTENQQKIIKDCDTIKSLILHLADEAYGLDLSGDQKAKVSTMKFELLSDFQKFETEIKRIIK